MSCSGFNGMISKPSSWKSVRNCFASCGVENIFAFLGVDTIRGTPTRVTICKNIS